MKTLALCLLLPTTALAAWPDDVTPSAMGEWQGSALVGSQEDAWLQLVDELGTAVANKPLAPAGTLGPLGFDLSTGTTLAFISHGTDDEPSPWGLAHTDSAPASVLIMPQLGLRKGLPMSLEVGMDAAWLGVSRQGTFGGYGRAALVEGYKPWPDLTVQLGYAGYVGNDELDLGVTDMGVSLGSTFPFGSFPGLRSAQFSPWVTYTRLRVRARATVDPNLAADLGLVEVAGKDSDAEGTPARVIHRVSTGFQIANGNYLLRIVGTWAPRTIPTMTLGMGFTY